MTKTIVSKLQTLRKQSNHMQHKLSALILYKGRPISFGINDQTKTHPEIRKYSEVKTMHAEMAAIFKIKDKEILKNCEVIVYREDRAGNMANSRPCEVCQAIFRNYGIKKVTYSTANGWKEEHFV
jgi:deoxycytidylate deaminase